MVRLARARVDAAGVAAELRVMDVEHLDVPDASFAAVLCGFGIFFLPDAERALAGFHRALVPRGTLGVSTWGAEDARAWEDELLADVVVERRAMQRPFDRPDDLDALLRGAGFDEVVVRTEQHDVQLADADEWWAWKWSYSLRGILEQLPQPQLERLRADAAERIAAMADDGGLPLRLEALIAIGHGLRPSRVTEPVVQSQRPGSAGGGVSRFAAGYQ